MKKRTRSLSALLLPDLLLLLALALAVPAAADEGDYDRIDNYVVTVDPRQDGSADITYEVDWSVIGGEQSDYLSWVKIGLANSHADEFTILTPDTVSQIDYLEDGGSYARLVFQKRYYAPDVAAAKNASSQVHFAFRVHQSHLFSLNDDSTASFEFTPGWFDDLCVQKMQIRWKNYDGFVADNTGTDGDYLTWDFGPLAHGQAGTARVTVPVITTAAYGSDQARTPEDWSGSQTDASDGEDDLSMTIALVLFFGGGVLLLVFIVWLLIPSKWDGGLGKTKKGYRYYRSGHRVFEVAPGETPPPGGRLVPPPEPHTGGGSTRGGGAGRHGGGGFSCACASSCACACACAGGGRAGCSAKNFYRIKMPPTGQRETTDGTGR